MTDNVYIVVSGGNYIDTSGNEVSVVVGAASNTLAGLSDTSITSVTEGDMLYYSSGAWINGDATAIIDNLGLGTMSLQNASAVAITGGTIAGTTHTNVELKDYAETRSTPSSSSGTLTLNIEDGNVFEVTLTENVDTTVFSNPSATGKGCSFTLILKQNGTGGFTMSWPATVKWGTAGTAPTLTTTASAIDILTFMTTDAGTTWYGFAAGLDMQLPA